MRSQEGILVSLSRYRGLVVLVMDVVLIFFFNFAMFFDRLGDENIQLFNLVMHIGLLTVCVLVFQLLFKTYDTLWRYAESQEYLTLLYGMGCGFLLYAGVNLVLGTNRVWIIEALNGTALALIAMLTIRFAYRAYRRRVNRRGTGAARCAAIIGAGNAGIALLNEFNDNVYGKFKPFCIIDDSKEKQRRRIHGVKVMGPVDNIVELLANTPVTDIIFAINNTTSERKRQILDMCANTRCRVHILGDPVVRFASEQERKLSMNVREVQIGDLLGREQVRLDNPRISEFVRGKTVLVTGGGGSIGSELCRQIAAYKPKRLVILDIAENTTYELQHELIHMYGYELPLSIEIASVRDTARLEQVFTKYSPELVLHAAAHKHVPLMEDCPGEAIKNNVFGTYNVACAARKHGAEKFVLISTDKAVNPTNVMGATKCLCEQIVLGMNGKGTDFAAVRFGNVLGSNGSVIPLFKKQIAYGGPVTITDKRIRRYFMTIPEAAQLVLEAGSFAHNGEVFVLDMGEPVLIADLADKLIRLSGCTPGIDIEVKEVGLRPGEKLYEELLTANGELHKTENEKILVEKRFATDEASIEHMLDELRQAVCGGDSATIIGALHKAVPSFRSPEEVNAEAIERVTAERNSAAAV